MSGARAELPEEWKWTRLADVAEINPRRPSDLERDDEATTTFVPMPAVNDSTGAITMPETKEFAEVRKGYTYFEEGDVIFAKITPCMQNGKHAIAKGLIDGIAFGSTEFHVIKPGPKIAAEWIHYFVRQPSVLNGAELAFTGSAGQQRVPKDFLTELEIPLPPLEEQYTVLEAVNRQMAEVDKARAATEAQLDAAEKLVAAYLHEVFEGDDAKLWPVKPLDETADISSGVALGRKLVGKETRPVPYLRVANVKDGYLDLSEVKETPATAVEIKKLRLQAGDMLLTEGGDPDKLGRGTFWQEELPECIHQNHIFRVRFDLNHFLPEFVSAQIGSSYGKAYFLAHAKQTTGIATINKTVLSNFPLKVLPYSEQKHVVDALNERLTEAQRVVDTMRSQLEAVNALPAALLRQAFSGQLVQSVTPEWTALPVEDSLTPEEALVLRSALACLAVDTYSYDFGRTKLVKFLYWLECYVGLVLNGRYRRGQYGPYDDAIEDVERVAQERNWFTSESDRLQKGTRYEKGTQYIRGESIDEALQMVREKFGDKLSKLDKLIAFFSRKETETIEAMSTLFAVRNDYLLEGYEPSLDEVVNGVRHEWHEKKKKFKPDRLKRSYRRMVSEGLEPSGIGPKTERTKS